VGVAQQPPGSAATEAEHERTRSVSDREEWRLWLGELV
jgi:hypothetical protein